MAPILLRFLLLLLPIANSWQIPADYALLPSPDGHFFQHANSTPFFWQADTAWLLFHRLNYTESAAYLTDRAAKGFNIVLAVGFTQIGIDSPNRAGDLPFVAADVTQPNEPYWSYIDAVVELAWTKGIRVALVPAWGKYVHSDTNAASVLTTTTAAPFGRFIGTRYPYLPKLLVADTNPVWANKSAVKAAYAAGGVPPSLYHTDWSGVYDALADGIVAGERAATARASDWRPLVSIHPTNQWLAGGPVALASAFFGDRAWLAFDAAQSGHADYPPNAPLPWWNARRGWETVERMWAAGEEGGRRPVLDNEAHYEGRYINGKSVNAYWNASDVRIGSWQAVLSGAAGVTYGADNVMQMYVPGLFEPAGSGPARSWADDIHLPGSAQMQHIRKAVEDRGTESFFRRVPAQDLVVGDAGTKSHDACLERGMLTAKGTDDKRVTATRDAGGSWIMVYTPTGKGFSIQTGALTGCNTRASWYDPLSGSYTDFDFTQCQDDSGAVKDFLPPTDDEHADWLLVLEQQE